jgi:hypothetical protein
MPRNAAALNRSPTIASAFWRALIRRPATKKPLAPLARRDA